MSQPLNNKVLLQARFFSSRRVHRFLNDYVQEMRPLSASITVVPIPEPMKVPMFLNGLRHGPVRQGHFRKLPSTM